MPVIKLLVEGKLDAELLGKILDVPGLTIEAAMASKNSLAPRVHAEREKSGHAGFFYLRDRDFDYEPPEDRSKPTADRHHKGKVLGWRWVRHSIENYMLEPAIAVAALCVDENVYRGKLTAVAREIAHYEAARWAIGQVRLSLPPAYELKTIPAEKEFHLPEDADLALRHVKNWLFSHVGEFRRRVGEALDETAVQGRFQMYCDLFAGTVARSLNETLTWFSGRDLLCGLSRKHLVEGSPSPKEMRNRIRDWMMGNPERVVELLEEWAGLLTVLRQA